MSLVSRFETRQLFAHFPQSHRNCIVLGLGSTVLFLAITKVPSRYSLELFLGGTVDGRLCSLQWRLQNQQQQRIRQEFQERVHGAVASELCPNDSRMHGIYRYSC